MDAHLPMEPTKAVQKLAANESNEQKAIVLPNRAISGAAICDRSGHESDKIYMHCQRCPDVVYCPSCSVDTSLIHPGHNFKASKEPVEIYVVEEVSRIDPPADDAERA
jgi:hypothetical protein